MKTGFIISAFVMGLIHLACADHACATEKKTAFSTPDITVKKSFFAGVEENNHRSGDKSIVINLRITNLLSGTVLAAIKENGTGPMFCHAEGYVPAIAEKERLLNDHLLHLFPSHYFW